MFSGKNIAFVSIVLILAAIAFFFLWKHFHHSDEEEAAPPAELKVPVVRVVSKALFREDQLPGEINAYQDVLVYPKVPGFIEWIGVDRGSVVKKDQLMLRIYAPEYLPRNPNWRTSRQN